MKLAEVILVIFYLVGAAKKKLVLKDIYLSFPKGFLIGTSSSAYQVEGAWNTDGKCESVWDYFVHNYPEKIVDRTTADISCDAYHHYKEDVKLIKKIGVDFYRFSMSWSRILPAGYPDYVNLDGLRYYHNLLDELEKHEIMPVVTIYHWDHPQKFEHEFGGWLNEKMAFLYADYVRVIFREFSHRVKIFTTINEPHSFCESAYTTATYLHAQNTSGWGQYLCIQNMLKAHALAYHVYDKEYRNLHDGKLGIVIPIKYPFSKNSSDIESVDVAYEFQIGLTAHPIFSKEGDYPKIVKKKVAERSEAQGLKKSRLPELTKYWIDYIKGSADYFGLNHYTSEIVEPLPQSDILIWPSDEGLLHSKDPAWPSSQTSWLKIVPEGFGATLRKIKDKYDNPVVYVMENGVSDGNGTNDDTRINYMRSYMKEMLIAMKRDGCNVQAYSYWSFLDSFEWRAGFSERFGLVDVDFNDTNRKRTPKKSVAWLANMIQARKLL